MSDSAKPKREKLWRAGLHLFSANWGEWAKWAVWFFVAMALLQAALLTQFQGPAIAGTLQKLTEAQKAKQSLQPQDYAALMQIGIQIAACVVPMMFVSFIQSFAYRVFFMKQQPGIGEPKLSLGRFFYLIWMDLQVFLILILIGGFFAAVPIGAMTFFGKTSPFVIPVAVIFGIIGVGFFVFIAYRLSLVPVLAVCAAKPVIKTSWRLMKGNCWRLFGNAFLLMLIVLGFWIGAAIIEVAVSMGLVYGAQTVFAHIAPDAVAATATQSFFSRYFMPVAASADAQIKLFIQIVFDTLNLCVLNGIIWAFFCAATRVLHDEYTTKSDVGAAS